MKGETTRSPVLQFPSVTRASCAALAPRCLPPKAHHHRSRRRRLPEPSLPSVPPAASALLQPGHTRKRDRTPSGHPRCGRRGGRCAPAGPRVRPPDPRAHLARRAPCHQLAHRCLPGVLCAAPPVPARIAPPRLRPLLPASPATPAESPPPEASGATQPPDRPPVRRHVAGQRAGRGDAGPACGLLGGWVAFASHPQVISTSFL